MKIGMIGCGVALEHHLPALRNVEDIEICWFCDPNEEQARRAMKSWGKSSTTGKNIDELLDSRRPDAVHICSPPATHAELTVKALEAGCHVLLEKPMAACVSEGEQILKARDRSGRQLCMMHNHLFDPPVVRARKLIERGLLGDLVYAEGRYFLDTPKMIEEGMDNPDHWVHGLNSGLASEYTPHTVYLLQSFLGPASEIQVIHENMNISPTVQPGLEVFAIQLRFARAVGRTLMLAKMPYGHFGIDLYGTRAAIHINMMDLTYRVEIIRKGLPLVAARMESTLEQSIRSIAQTAANAFRIGVGNLRRRPGHRTLIKEFYRSLRRNGPVPVPGEEGLSTVRTLEMLDREIGSVR